MMLRSGPSLNAEEKKLLEMLRQLGPEQRETVTAFVEFLAGRVGPKAESKLEGPTPLPRPAQESVVKAIKRLRETYPMLDHGKMLHETSNHMSEHLIHGKPAAQVIDQLEVMFEAHYQRYCESMEDQSSSTPEGDSR